MREGHDVINHSMDTKNGHANLGHLIDIGKHIKLGSMRRVAEHHSYARRKGGDKDDTCEICA